MQLHELKIKQEYLNAVKSGKKPFEIRKNDRNFQVGDLINFRVVVDQPLIGNRAAIERLRCEGFDVVSREERFNEFEVSKRDEDVYQITYVLKDVPQYGLDKDYCIFGLKRLVEE